MFLAVVLLYLAALTAAASRARGARSSEDFFVAERAVPARLVVFTLVSAWIGAGSLFAGAGRGYRTGLAALWQPAGAWAGIVFLWWIAPRVRRLARYSVPDILELRYGAVARTLGTTLTVLAYMAIAAYQFRAGGRLLQLAGGISPVTGALVTAAFCVAFTAVGGMRSVTNLDVANGSAILTGVVVAVAYLLGRSGGTGPALAALRPDQMTVFGTMSPFDALALFLPTVVLVMGEASVYQKAFSAASERGARRAVAGWLAATIPIEILLVSLGALGSIVVPGLDAEQSDTIVVRLALGSLPALAGVLLLVSATAIVISSANSFLLVASTNLVRDVYPRFVTRAASDGRLLAASRIAVVLVGFIAAILAIVFPRGLSIAILAYTMYGAGVPPALVAALIWPRATREAGIASIAMGVLVTLVWEIAAGVHGSHPAGLPTIYIALISSVATLVAITLAAPAPPLGAPPPEHRAP